MGANQSARIRGFAAKIVLEIRTSHDSYAWGRRSAHLAHRSLEDYMPAAEEESDATLLGANRKRRRAQVYRSYGATFLRAHPRLKAPWLTARIAKY